jgi:hypothetical protein
VLDRFVSPSSAQSDYGVVLSGSVDQLDLAVDGEATDRLRRQRRSESEST